MKKNVIKLFILILVLLPMLNVQAESNIKIEKKTYITTGSRKEAKFYTNKGYAYCITPHRRGADQGAILKYYGKETKGGVLYLIEKSGTNDYDYLTTQLAMWILKDNYMPDYYVNNPNLNVVKKAKSLAAEAAKQGNYQSNNPTVTISTNNSTFTETSDGQYYKTGIIKITATNYKNEPKIELINAPSGAQIKEIDNKFINNTKRIEIQIPINSITETKRIELKVTSTGKVNHLEKYTTGNSALQDLVILISENKTVTKNISLTVNPINRICEYYNDKYYDKNGKVTTKEEYDIQCKSHVCEIIGNRYFGNNGEEVSELVYKEQCEPKQVIVPDTKVNPINDTILIVIGSMMLGTVIGTLTHYYGKKENK